MTKLELLHVFLNDRLTAAARDIFGAVKDAVVEYQTEILRSKEENERLRRLLNAAVQRLLLQAGEEQLGSSAEPPPAHAQDDFHLRESEWRSQVEFLPNIKEEPKLRNLPDVSQGAGDSRGNCSHAEQQTPNHLSARNASPSPPTSVEVKTESCREADAVHPDVEEAGTDCCTTTKIPELPKPEPPVKGPLHSNGKPSPHVLQIKNARPLKLPLSRSSHTTQSIQRWHSCKECGKGFSFACQLEVHMRWHTKEKPYSCAVCRKSFTTVSMLKRHHRIHTGEKPFRCHVCGKCFNQSAHLNTHFRLHTRERAAWNRPAQGK